nr:hypothetical protein [Tanacetum cinerariifolium]
MFNTIRVIYRHQDTHVYGAILPAVLTNQEMLDSKAYKEYYIVASGAKTLKAKTNYKKKADEYVTSSKYKTDSASKGTRLKSKSKVDKPNKKKKPSKKTKTKGLVVLYEVALLEVKQIKLASKRSKKDIHMSHASGSGDGVDTQSKAPDEQEQNTSGSDQGSGTIPGVPDVPPYESESDKESWGDSEDEDGNDDGDNNDDGKSDDQEDDSDYERLKSDSDEIPDQNLTNDDEENDKFLKELYEDVNVNLEKGDAKMTDANQRVLEQQNVSQESGFKQEEDAYIPNFAFVFKFDQMVPALESEMSDLKQTNQFAKVVSLIPSIVDKYLAPKMKEVVNVAVQLQINKLREEAQADNQDFLNEDEDPSTGSNRGTKRRKSGKDAESSKDLRSKENKSSSTSKDASKYQHNSSGKSVHREEPSHIVEESIMQQDQEIVTGENDEQHVDKEVTKADWFKKPKRPPTPDPD